MSDLHILFSTNSSGLLYLTASWLFCALCIPFHICMPAIDEYSVPCILKTPYPLFSRLFLDYRVSPVVSVNQLLSFKPYLLYKVFYPSPTLKWMIPFSKGTLCHWFYLYPYYMNTRSKAPPEIDTLNPSFVAAVCLWVHNALFSLCQNFLRSPSWWEHKLTLGLNGPSNPHTKPLCSNICPSF